MKTIAVIGANPAWQKTLFFDDLRHNGINRALRVDFLASGKGINFARAAMRSGLLNPIVLQFSGGLNGEMLEERLDAEHLPYRSVAIAGETRCCTTCLAAQDNSMTELIEPAPAINQEEADEFLELLKLELVRCDMLAICGTSPVFAAERNFSLRCAKLAREYRKPLLLDAYCDIDPVLSLESDILLKINADELATLTARKTVRGGLALLARRNPRLVVAITDGERAAFLSAHGRLFRFDLPQIKVVNPLGSGDTASAVFAGNFLRGAKIERAFAAALAAASANCMTERCADFDPAAAAKILKKIAVTEL